MKTWKAIGLLPLILMSACDADTTAKVSGYDGSGVWDGGNPPAPAPQWPSPAPMPTPDQSSVSASEPVATLPAAAMPEDCSAPIVPLSGAELVVNTFKTQPGYSYHAVSFKIAETKLDGTAKTQMRLSMYNPNSRNMSFVKPAVECLRTEALSADMEGGFEFPLGGAFPYSPQATMMESNWKIQNGSMVGNTVSASGQDSNFSKFTTFENYLSFLSSFGADVHLYQIDHSHFQLMVTSYEASSRFWSETKTSVVYEYVQNPSATGAPGVIATPTPLPAPMPVVTPTPEPMPTGPNRCGAEYSYITIDKKAAFHAASDSELFDNLNALTASGFCNSKSTLGAEYSYITFGDKAAFHFDNAAAGIKALIALYKAKAGTPETARCGAEYSYITLDGNASFHFNDSETGIQRLITLIANNTCKP